MQVSAARKGRKTSSQPRRALAVHSGAKDTEKRVSNGAAARPAHRRLHLNFDTIHYKSTYVHAKQQCAFWFDWIFNMSHHDPGEDRKLERSTRRVCDMPITGRSRDAARQSGRPFGALGPWHRVPGAATVDALMLPSSRLRNVCSHCARRRLCQSRAMPVRLAQPLPLAV